MCKSVRKQKFVSTEKLNLGVSSAFRDGGKVQVHSMCGYELQCLRSLMLT